MPLNERYVERIRDNMSTLDYFNGEGIIPRGKRKIGGDVRYVIVGLGGTGCTALVSLKKKIERKVDPSSIGTFLRFLAIDSSHVDLDKYLLDGSLRKDDICKLNFQGVQDLAERQEPPISHWINPRLYEHTREVFKGEGAGARRQAGRVLLCNGVNYQLMTQAFNAKFRQLHSDKSRTKVHLILLAGVAGGTGSGMILDAAYILKHQLDKEGTNPNPSSYGFVFLPPAASDKIPDKQEDITNGNSNGYAAVKEIEYHMAMEARGEHPEMVYDGCSDTITFQSLFNHCFLIDGKGSTFLPNLPRTVAANTASDCIINMITAETTIKGTSGSAAHSSILSHLPDKAMKRTTFIKGKTPLVLPRDAYCDYAATGYVELSIPRDLLRIYAAKKVLDYLMRQWEQMGTTPTIETARGELSSLGLLHVETLRKSLRRESNRTLIIGSKGEKKEDVEESGEEFSERKMETMKARLDTLFKSNGPSYLVKLLPHMASVLRGNIAERSSWSSRKEYEYHEVNSFFGQLIDYLESRNAEVYEVYEEVVKYLSITLNKTSEILTGETGNGRLGDTFIKTPLQTENGRAVLRALDELLIEKTISYASSLVNALAQEEGKWTGLAKGGVFDAAGQIRHFVNETFKDVLDPLTLEDIIAICYSGKTSARAMSIGDGSANDKPTTFLEDAAIEIAQVLDKDAEILAQINERYNYESSETAKYLILPSDDETGHLNNLIRQQPVMSMVSVFNSESSDSFTFFNNYLTLPLFAFRWVALGEQAYANTRGNVGQHMNEREENWRDFPNLIPAGKWSYQAEFGEEVELSTIVRRMMEKARAYKIVDERNEGENYEADLFLLNDGAGTLLGKAFVELGKEDGNATRIYDEVAKKLLGMLELDADTNIDSLFHILPESESKRKGTKPVTCEMHYGKEPLDGWEWDFTCKFMRKMYHRCLSLQRTLGVLDRLKELAAVKISEIEFEGVELQCQNAFRRFYGVGLINWDAEKEFWEFENENGRKRILLDLVDLDAWQQLFHFYFMMQELYGRFDELSAYWESQFNERKDAQRDEIKQRQAKLKAEVQKINQMIDSAQWEKDIKKVSGDSTIGETLSAFYENIVAKL